MFRLCHHFLFQVPGRALETARTKFIPPNFNIVAFTRVVSAKTTTRDTTMAPHETADDSLSSAPDNTSATTKSEVQPDGQGYRDYANEKEDPSLVTTDARNGSNSEQNFPVKLHYMLSDMEADGLDHIVSWQPHGRCFIVHKPNNFAEKILPL